MNDGQRIILVTGATGQQGGAVARHLLGTDFHVRALTRDPDKPAARALADAGAEVVRGDLDDAASLPPVLEGVYGVFSVQNFWETGYDREVEQGKRLVDAAREAGVQHFVYTSVGSADEQTGIPHFDSKAEIEDHLRASGLPYTILRPVFFMGNWLSDYFVGVFRGGTFYWPLDPDRPLQQVAVDDVGAFAAKAFQDPGRWLGREVDLAGDAQTMPEVAEAFGRVLGQPVRYVQVSWEAFTEAAGEEWAIMCRWFNDVGYSADVEALRREHPGLVSFDAFVERQARSALAPTAAG